ncbi:hypothetical protein H1C71_023112 [Ictidomys tridecemlineatus]|nr:hypothetical protein H1C71_023112 [Ictidomys tridecemlineatus]
MSTRSSCDSSQLLLSNIHAVNKRIVGSLGTIIIKHEDFQLFSCIVLEWRKCLNIASSTEALCTLDSDVPFFYGSTFEVIQRAGIPSFLPEQECELYSSATSE